jgi:hypothetical protein
VEKESTKSLKCKGLGQANPLLTSNLLPTLKSEGKTNSCLPRENVFLISWTRAYSHIFDFRNGSELSIMFFKKYSDTALSAIGKKRGEEKLSY